jgi:hydrogenase maturation protease
MVTICLVGVGSPYGDDRVGWLIADELQYRLGTALDVHKVGTPLSILDRIDGINWLGICDGCRGLESPGAWRRWTWPNIPFESEKFTGSHDLGLIATLQLAESLGRLPQRVVIWGVDIQTCSPEDHISLSVNAAVRTVASSILLEINQIQDGVDS